MTSNRDLPVADVADRHRRYFAYAMLFVALVHAAEAAEELLDPDIARVARLVSIAGALGVFFFIGRVLLWKARNLSSSMRDLYLDPDGFLADALSRAHAISWGVTFLFMAMVARLDRTLSGLTGVTLVYIAVALMTATFGASFLWLARDRDGESAEEARRA